MRTFQRWTLGITRGFQQTLSELENHEAVSQAALGDMRKSLGRATAQAARLRKGQQDLVREAEEASRMAERWTERAARETRQEPGLECLRRAHACRHKASALRERAAAGRTRLEEVEARIRKEEARYLDLRDKHRLYRARQVAARASSACESTMSTQPEVEDVFERWDLRISEEEYLPEAAEELKVGDSFADSYEKSEEQQALAEEWRQIRRVSSDVASSSDDAVSSDPAVSPGGSSE